MLKISHLLLYLYLKAMQFQVLDLISLLIVYGKNPKYYQDQLQTVMHKKIMSKGANAPFDR